MRVAVKPPAHPHRLRDWPRWPEIRVRVSVVPSPRGMTRRPACCSVSRATLTAKREEPSWPIATVRRRLSACC